MDHRTITTRIVYATLALGLVACTFDPSGIPNLDTLLPWQDEVPFVTPTSESLQLQFESPGLLAVHHGETCAEGQKTLKVQQQLPLPREHDRGTVLLNGYRMRFLGSQTWIKALGTAIGAISTENGVLSWNAAGALADGEDDDTIEWCYNFTTVSWNSLTLQAVVDHGDLLHTFRDMAWNRGTALRPMPGILTNPAFVGSPEVAILPRGFLMIWNDDSHQLLQIAHHQAAAERYVEAGKRYGHGEMPIDGEVSSAASDTVTWESMGFLKNDDLERSQTIAEMVTAFAGRDVGIINPPFNVTPQEDYGSGCSALGGSGVESEERSVVDVPFEFAIPVLSGWALSYACNDEAVKSLGAWIPKWSWTPGPTGGTLTYTVSTLLEDDDRWPFFISRSQIKILGFRRLTKR